MSYEQNEDDVAYKDGTTAHEDLPFPIVHYPGHYGTFFAFQSREDEQLTICACAKEAVSNYIKLKINDYSNHYQREADDPILESNDFPLKLVEQLSLGSIKQDLSLIDQIEFQTGLCHECTEKIPSLHYCDAMYGSFFEQNFGWYVNKKYYEYGIDPTVGEIDPTICSKKILDAINFDPSYTYSNYIKMKDISSNEAEEFWKKFNEMRGKLGELIQNEVRLKFGHKKLGETWTTETLLFYIVSSQYPEYSIRRHYRPKFLEGLELDIYIEELKLGIEYQGIQHFQPIEHWGGQNAFVNLVQRDNRKKALCEALGIRLVFFNYNEKISNELVFNRLKV